ncbi:MAG: enoyl-CoA hydratase/isomerase family protein [Alphaproteobacteria bacterium]|nr:enoyl-CoA hydratase/isomerase family protein [Alphaproteobacteria bacterium]
MAFDSILLQQEDGIATVTLNRPQALNSLNRQIIEDIRAALRQTSADNSVRALIITGAGRGFCAGADLIDNGFGGDGVARSRGQGILHSMEIGYNPLVRDLSQYPKPIVTAVNGVAAGGGVGLALSGDIVLAGKSAYFVQVFGPRLGLVPDMGCTWYLPMLLGRARSRALALLGDRLPAEKAAEWGLIWQAVDDDGLQQEARNLAQRLAAGPTQAFARIKELLDAAPRNTLDEQLELERRVQGVLGEQQDFIEGVTAFIQKREPKFKGE